MFVTNDLWLTFVFGRVGPQYHMDRHSLSPSQLVYRAALFVTSAQCPYGSLSSCRRESTIPSRTGALSPRVTGLKDRP